MGNGIAFAVHEHIGNVGKLGNTVVGGLPGGNLDSVTGLEGSGAVAIGIEGTCSVGKDGTTGGESHDYS